VGSAWIVFGVGDLVAAPAVRRCEIAEPLSPTSTVSVRRLMLAAAPEYPCLPTSLRSRRPHEGLEPNNADGPP